MIDPIIAKQRAELTQKIRDFFTKNNFLEVETPIMTPTAGMEPHLTPFETKFIAQNGQATPLFLNTSPELQMKKLLGNGFSNIFNITKVFRNGEMGGPTHNPEFTMLEWYRTNSDYKAIMEDCEKLVVRLAGGIEEKIGKKKSPVEDSAVAEGILAPKIAYQSQTIDLSLPWDRKTTKELFQEYLHIDLLENQDYETFKKTAENSALDINSCNTWDEIFFKLFLNHIEPHLGIQKPIFVYDYPSTQAALAKKCPSQPFFAERFELYIAGLELCNAFSELIDPEEQRARLVEEQQERKQLNKTILPIDEDFLTQLSRIPHPCAGNALGLDRLFMLLLDKASIDEVLLFPLNQMITTQP